MQSKSRSWMIFRQRALPLYCNNCSISLQLSSLLCEHTAMQSSPQYPVKLGYRTLHYVCWWSPNSWGRESTFVPDPLHSSQVQYHLANPLAGTVPCAHSGFLPWLFSLLLAAPCTCSNCFHHVREAMYTHCKSAAACPWDHLLYAKFTSDMGIKPIR